MWAVVWFFPLGNATANGATAGYLNRPDEYDKLMQVGAPRRSRGGPPPPTGDVRGGDRMTNEEVVRRYAGAMVTQNHETLDELRHAEWTAIWPQSGEVVRGSANDRQIMERYPGGAPRLLPEGRLMGSEDRWVVSPLGGGAYRVAGEGEVWMGEWRMAYPDGRMWFTIVLLELRYGKVWRETVYWAEPFAAPEWRAEWVERIPTG